MRWYYKITKPGSDLPIDEHRNRIDFGLVECPACGVKRSDCAHITTMNPASSGSQYLRRAWRALCKTKNAEDLTTRWPLYERFATLLKAEFPALLVFASMDFGVLQIEVERLVDLASPGWGVMVLKKKLADCLKSRGLGIEFWPTKTTFARGIQPMEYVEIAALPVASAAPGEGISLCPKCLRSSYRGPVLPCRPCKLSAASVPKGVDAFRILESPTNVIVSERFLEEVSDLDCGNVQWVEVSAE